MAGLAFHFFGMATVASHSLYNGANGYIGEGYKNAKGKQPTLKKVTVSFFAYL